MAREVIGGIPRSLGRVYDLSVGATNQYVVLEAEKGLCTVDLFAEDGTERVKVILKTKIYEPGKIETNPHLSHAAWVASTCGSALALWDLAAERTLLAMHHAHQRVITGLSWNRHCPTIVTTSSLDSTIKLWDVRVPKTARTCVIKSFVSSQSHIEWSPHHAHLLGSSHGGEVKLWDIRIPEYPLALPADVPSRQEDRFLAYMSDICALSWAKAEDNVLLACAKDKPMKLWNTAKFPSQQLYTIPMNFPVQSAMFLPHSSHHIITSHSSHASLYLWDSENSDEPLFSLYTGDDPIVAFDFQTLLESQNTSNHTCVIAITRELALKKWPIPSDFVETSLSPPDETKAKHNKLHQDEEFVPLDLALEFARAVQSPIPGTKIEESNSVRRTICISFTSKRLGEFKLRVSFPTMYPHGAAPGFEFLAPHSPESEHERIEILRHLSGVADSLVAHSKFCLQPCLRALSDWTASHLGDIVDPHPPTPTVGNISAIFNSPTASPNASPIESAKSRVRARSLPPQMESFSFLDKRKSASPALPPIDEGANSPLKLYTVGPTDTLLGVAIAFGMQPTSLKKLNRLYSNQIIAGQQLWVNKHVPSADSPTIPHSPAQPTHSVSEVHLQNDLHPTPPSPFSELRDSSLPSKRYSLTQSEIVKQDIIYWSPTFCVGGTLTLTPQVLIFEPSIDDPLVIQGGILQFQLCIELSQVCSLKLYRTQHDFKLKLKTIKHHRTPEDDEPKDIPDSDVEKHKELNVPGNRRSVSGILDFNKTPDKVEVEMVKDTGPTIYPCMEIIVLTGRRMQTVYLGHLQLMRVEPLYNQIKQWAVQSKAEKESRERPAGLSSSPHHIGTPTSQTHLQPPGLSPSALKMSTGSPLPAYLHNTQILDALGVKRLRSCLPSRFHSVDWELLYSSYLDGISINTFYTLVRNAAPSLLLVEDSNGHIFGAFVSEAWKENSQGGYYGTGESFLFKLSPEFEVYRWSRKNEFIMCSTPNWLAVGGGDAGFGLYLDADFEYGTSTASSTFNSPSLSSTAEFKCTVLEAWGFIR